MHIERICWLREILVSDDDGQDRVAMEFSCDRGIEHSPRFFRVSMDDLPQACALYREWGGMRTEGYRIGTTAQGPCLPATASIRVWRENGNH